MWKILPENRKFLKFHMASLEVYWNNSQIKLLFIVKILTSITPFANPSYISYCNIVWGSANKLFEAYLKWIVIC